MSIIEVPQTKWCQLYHKSMTGNRRNIANLEGSSSKSTTLMHFARMWNTFNRVSHLQWVSKVVAFKPKKIRHLRGNGLTLILAQRFPTLFTLSACNR